MNVSLRLRALHPMKFAYFWRSFISSIIKMKQIYGHILLLWLFLLSCHLTKTLGVS